MPSDLTADQAAFCRREHPRLVGALVLYLGDAETALDLAQEALARACAAWGRVSRMHAPGAWLHRVAINLAKRHLRRGLLARRAVERHDAPVATWDADVADRLAVRAAVTALPPRQRTALVLRYYSDLPVIEVARIMGCRPGTVQALTSQALAKLRGDLLHEAVADD